MGVVAVALTLATKMRIIALADAALVGAKVRALLRVLLEALKRGT
jgi:hypothetical protein